MGSTPIAKYIYETGARNGKRVQALGGAKNHAIVMPDADLDFATEAIIGAGYGSAGERCMAISAVVAVGDVADALVDRLAVRARAVTIGPGDATDIEMGPVITCAARDRITGLIDRGVDRGRDLVVDGRRPKIAGHEGGFFVGPTLFDRVKPDMAMYREEIFGPVLTVVRSESLADAIAMINANPYANGAALFTRSGHAARRFQQDVEVGHGGHQRTDPRADGLLLVRRLAQLAVRRLERPWRGWRAVLHAAEDRNGALARRWQRGPRVPHAADGLTAARSGGSARCARLSCSRHSSRARHDSRRCVAVSPRITCTNAAVPAGPSTRTVTR